MADSSQTPLADALAKPLVIPDLPDNTIVVVGEKTPQDLGVTVQAEMDPGHPGGLFAGASASWWQTAGYKALVWIGWRPGA